MVCKRSAFELGAALEPETLDRRRNPARVSPALAQLFPTGVVAAQLYTPGVPALLHTAERRCVRFASSPRLAEFAAGRHCAHRAMAELGIRGQPVRKAADRAPQWPSGLVGSITHTVGYSAAVVARRGPLLSVGIDAEMIAHVRSELWAQICTAQELAALRALPPAAQQDAAALCFTAKEAFYKCQYALTHEWLDFNAVEIESRDWTAHTGSFSVRPRTRMILEERIAMPLVGTFLSAGEHLCSAIAIHASKTRHVNRAAMHGEV